MVERDIFDVDLFEYVKRESFKEEFDVDIPTPNLKNEEVADETQAVTEQNESPLGAFGDSFKYEKEWGSRSPYKIIMICEDEKRTYIYFNTFISQIDSGRYQLIPIQQVGGIPFPRMVKKADSVVAKMGLNFEEGDSLFLISDLDHYRDSILNSVRTEGWNNKYQLIISNPCIEIWFYYHYKDLPPSIDIQSVKERDISKLMKQFNNSIVKGGVNHRSLATIEKLEIAIENSKNNFTIEDNGIIPMLFSTQMHIVAEQIREAIK